MKTASERFIEIFHTQDGRIANYHRFINAVNEFQKETGLKAPFNSYDSLRESLRRKTQQSCK